jgi:hypothetical protein
MAKRTNGIPRFLTGEKASVEESEESAAGRLRRLIDGYQVSQAIYVAATLGIADRLADGPRTSDELATATGSHPGALYRLLRALASVGIFREEDGRFSLTPLGQSLRTDVPESVHGWAGFIGRPYYWSAWGHLLDSVRTGRNAVRSLYGKSVWEYRAERPDESAIFDRAMMALNREADRSLLQAFDFGRFATIVDVGGGNGAFLAALLAEHLGMRGVLFDQPHVVSGAKPVLEAAGVADRCVIVDGSFFQAVPELGDAYVLKMILHDWEDPGAIAVLRSCRRAIPQTGRVLVVERVLGPPNEDRETKFSDLNMLVSPGGRERTLDEFADLFESAGFRVEGATPTSSGFQVIEGAPA